MERPIGECKYVFIIISYGHCELLVLVLRYRRQPEMCRELVGPSANFGLPPPLGVSDSRVFRGPITQLALWVMGQWALGALQTSSVTHTSFPSFSFPFFFSLSFPFLFPFFSLLFLPLGAQPKPLWAPGPSTLWRVTPPLLHAPDDNNDNNLVCFDKSVTDGQMDWIANCRLTLACQYLN